MANRASAGNGLTPSMTLGNTPATGGQSKYVIQSNESTSIYQGAPVKTASGYIVEGTSNTTGTQIGVFNGCFYTAPTTLKPTWSNYYAQVTPPNSENIQCFVNDNPWQEYTILTDAAVTQAGFMETYGLNTAAGSTTTGRSTNTLDIGATNATGYQWRLVRVAEDPENEDITAAYCKVVVVANLNEFKDSA